MQSAIEEQRITLELFPELSEIFFCPNWGESCYQLSKALREFPAPIVGDGMEIPCRKPGYGMILVAAQGLTDLSNCWMVGDRPEDQQCAEAAGVKFVWASVMHAKFAGPGMPQSEWQHIEPDVLMQFLRL